MTKKFEIYRCSICGNIIQVLHSGADSLVCCNKPMELLKPETEEDGLKEKHVPIFTEEGIQIGSTLHPMSKEHYIEFVETITKDKKDVHIHFFTTEEEPKIDMKAEKNYTCAIEYCNLHGLWQGGN